MSSDRPSQVGCVIGSKGILQAVNASTDVSVNACDGELPLAVENIARCCAWDVAMGAWLAQVLHLPVDHHVWLGLHIINPQYPAAKLYLMCPQQASCVVEERRMLNLHRFG